MRAAYAAAWCLCASLCACKPSPIAGEPAAAYQSRGGLFSCLAPARWRVVERQGGFHLVSFFGPPDGPAPYSISLSLYYYPKTPGSPRLERYILEQRAAARRFEPPRRWPWPGGCALRFDAWAQERQARHETTILIPRGGGYYAWALSAPQSDGAAAEDLLRQVIDSFRPVTN
ncbi:MAG: hypothetical protein KGO96_01775 [Elusimicrobia bacterium]|nr:hypothetical protein [Elusimicrobiota bacterium]MDE2424624.1 hypothetical protein [Elusimicrobiota bacterium]